MDNGKEGGTHLEYWKIIHVPDKPPVAPHLQPTVNVLAASVEPKHANTVIRKLNQIAPLENLRHVKRVRKKCLDGGKTELLIVLCMACEDITEVKDIPSGVAELINSYKLSTSVARVCKYAASTKEEWEEQCKLWPTSYHPPTYNISGITGFTEEESQSISSFMKIAVGLAKSGGASVVNAAVIVDPSSNEIIACAADQVLSWTSPVKEIETVKGCSKHFQAITRCNSTELKDHQCFPLNGSLNEPTASYDCVSCLHPWRWAEQRSSIISGSWHPLWHAAIAAIENSAARDRSLFPDRHDVNRLIPDDGMLPSPAGSPFKKQKTSSIHAEIQNMDCGTNGGQSDTARPYLCTGYDIYLVWEPCTMCAMALVHQRVKRIFFAFPNIHSGALESVHRLQGERSLNHHYAVFRVLLPEEVLKDETLFIRTDYDQKTSQVSKTCHE